MESTKQRDPRVTHDGGRWWYTDLDIRRSVERCRHYHQRSTEAGLWCGLELMRAKIVLKRKGNGDSPSDDGQRGEPVVGAFLKAIGISPATASRRETLAKQFLVWADIADTGRYEMPEMRHLVAAMDLLASECFNMKRFADHLASQVDRRDPLANEPAGRDPLVGGKTVFGHSLKSVFKLIGVIDHQINGTNRCLRWTPDERREAEDTLVILRNQFDRLINDLASTRTWEGARKRILGHR